MMNEQQSLVKEFMVAMEQPVNVGFNDLHTLQLGMSIILEETLELTTYDEQSAITKEGIKDAVDAMARTISAPKNEGEKVALIKELTDLLYVVYWLANAIGVDINEAFRRVHTSNMSKLDPDTGKPIRRADGKVLKGIHYHLPDLSDLVK